MHAPHRAATAGWTAVFARWAEDFVFGRRRILALGFAALTAMMAVHASRIAIDAGFEKTLPRSHPFTATFREYRETFGGANRVLIALVLREGNIFTPEFFRLLRTATDEVFFLPGVDRAQVSSLLTPDVRYLEVVEEGLAGGLVVPADFRPTPEGLEQVRRNLLLSGRVGQLVAGDFSGAVIVAGLIERDPRTGAELDYRAFAERLEAIRGRFESEAAAAGLPLGVHILGFAQVVGDVSEAASGVMLFFLISLLVTGGLVHLYGQSFRLTVLPLVCSAIAVVWQLGALSLLGYGIDPLSILVPFLIFAISVSHGVQMVRGFRAEVFDGAGSLDAARRAFRQLFVPGSLALATDTIGFLTLLTIDVGMIREMAVTASLGVAVIIITNLFLLPILLSYVRLPAGYRERVQRRKSLTSRFWLQANRITRPGPSIVVLAASVGLCLFGLTYAARVPVGDFGTGVPELRADARYNVDTRVVASKFSFGLDVFTVIAELPSNGVVDPAAMDVVDRLGWRLRNVEGVHSVQSLPAVARTIHAAWNEGALKWRVVPAQRDALAQAVSPVETATGLLNADGSRIPIQIYLEDHRAETLQRVRAAVEGFAAEERAGPVRFRLATGNAGLMAATNEVVEQAQLPVLLWAFGAIAALCLLTFRSLRATLCIVLPLALVSVLSYAVMYHLGIGLKVSTLPVVSLGVGIGVDYGIYLFSRLRIHLAQGDFIEDAMMKALRHTGSAVVFTGLTLGIGVATWMFSGLKFQADMGLLLTFMFVVNMVAAILVLPALARWLYRHRRRVAGRTEPPWASVVVAAGRGS